MQIMCQFDVEKNDMIQAVIFFYVTLFTMLEQVHVTPSITFFSVLAKSSNVDMIMITISATNIQGFEFRDKVKKKEEENGTTDHMHTQ